jgi:hypothetical protein
MSTRLPGGALVRNAGTIRGTANPTLAAALAREVVVEVDKEPTHATIVRGGLEVETPVVNPTRAASILENFTPVIRQEEPRSVRQSIAAGTLVTHGTAIDIELLAPAQVTLGIFEGVHLDLRPVAVTALNPLLTDPEVLQIIAKPTTALTPADRQNLTAKLATANVAVDDAVPDRSLTAAIAGLKTAKAFG